MKSTEKIKALHLQLLAIEKEWQALVTNRRNQINYFGTVSLKDLGIQEKTADRYEFEIQTLKAEIAILVAEEIKNVVDQISEIGVKMPLFDYTIPFQVDKEIESDYDDKLEVLIIIRCLKGILLNQGLDSIFEQIKSEQGFFNQRSVRFVNGKFAYKHFFNEVKSMLVDLHFYSKSGTLTIVSKIAQKELALLIDKSDELISMNTDELRAILRDIVRRSIEDPNLENVVLNLVGAKKARKSLENISKVKL